MPPPDFTSTFPVSVTIPLRPRNADRQHHLTSGEFLRLCNAHAFARGRGTPLNTHVTIHWPLAQGFREEDWHVRQTDLLNDKLVKWLQRRGWPVAFVWVKEYGRRRDKGPHTHLFLHLPPDAGKHAPGEEARKQLGDFLTRAGPFGPRGTNGSNNLPVFVSASRGDRAARKLLRYLGKTLNPAITIRAPSGPLRMVDALSIRPEANRAPIPTKRSGCSKSIGPKARKEAGWTEMRSLQEVLDYLPPPNGYAGDNHALTNGLLK